VYLKELVPEDDSLIEVEMGDPGLCTSRSEVWLQGGHDEEGGAMGQEDEMDQVHHEEGKSVEDSHSSSLEGGQLRV